MAGFNNKIMFADNVDFSGTKGQNPNILLDGHLLIGSTSTPNIRTGVLTSTGGTLNISYVSPNINLEVANPSSGTVTSVSVVSANGLAGTVATATTTPAITLSTTATGVLSGNGTAISGSAVTQYDVLVGGASNAISSVGPGTSGQILQSGGNAANPAYSTTTYPSTNPINTILYASSANVMSALATANNGTLVTSATGVPSIATLTDGQVIIGSSVGAPIASTITAGSNISIVNGHNSITISADTVSQSVNYTNVNTSPYLVGANDFYLSVDCSAGAITLNFPNLPSANRIWIVKDRTGSAATHNITITTLGGTLDFDGATSYVIKTNYEALNILANATPNYEIY